jgi:biotin/methionine sulfoxide reductase
MGNADPVLLAMPALTRPHGEARDDYAIFADLAERLGVGAEFTEGRTAMEWLEHLYEDWRERVDALPSFSDFWAAGSVELPRQSAQRVLLSDFRADPKGSRLATASGRIEVHSSIIESFDYADCPGHPAWLGAEEPTAEFPLHLMANQPKTRLHSQLDVGEYSRDAKVQDREPLRIHPDDAAARGLADGDVVRVFNDLGACLAGVRVSDAVRRGVVQLSTGAWYDPDPENPRFCRHGNPNVLIPDRPTSSLAQACAGGHTVVEVHRFTGLLPDLTVLDRP